MLPAEYALLVRDKLASAEIKVRRNAAPNSLTEKILNGWFGGGGKTYLFHRAAHDMARNSLGY